MKVKKIEDKPMVIHTKKKPRLHLHTGKKAENTVTVKRKRPHPGIRDKMAESGKSVKVRNQSLKTMAAAGARAGARQIEGGEEIKESLDLAAAATAPVMGITSGAGKLYRRKKAENKEKKGEKKRNCTNSGEVRFSGHAREKGSSKKKGRNGKKRNGKKDGSGKKRGKGSVNGAVKGRMIDTFLENFRTERAEQKDLITSTKSAAKAAALLLAKQAAVALAPLLLIVFFVIAIAGIIVVAILAVIYNSPPCHLLPPAGHRV